MAVTPKVSVIVAAYNAEKYLKRCLDSIAAQTLIDWECLVVDDGSTDKTGILAEEQARKDSRFVVIHQKNCGVAMARQTGLNNAHGEFSLHVDSDDWIEPDMLESMYHVGQEQHSDLIISDFIIVHPGGFFEYRPQKPKSTDRIAILGEMFFDLQGSLCNTMIRKECFERYGIRMVSGMDLAEDQYTILRLLSHPVSISYIPKAFYHYDHTQNVLSLCNQGVRAEKRLRPLEMIREYTDITPVQDDFDKAIFHLAYEYLYEPRSLCPDYRSVFKKHYPSIRRAKGFPFYTKLLILLKLWNINLPLASIKSSWNKFMSKRHS